MKKLLALTDFSENSFYAVDAAIMLAESTACSVDILYAMSESESVKINLVDDTDLSIYNFKDNTVVTKLKDWQSLAKSKSMDLSFICTNGKLVQYVKEYCNDNKPDIIIMGSKGKSQNIEKWWGSNTENIIKNITYPVLALKQPLKDYNFKNVVYASSFDAREKGSFFLFQKLFPLDSDSVLHLLSINTSSFYSQPAILINSVMEDYKKLSGDVKAQVHFYRDYSVEAGIRHFNEKINPDLVIMSNKIQKPVKHILWGNDAVDIANTLDYPVLILNYPD